MLPLDLSIIQPCFSKNLRIVLGRTGFPVYDYLGSSRQTEMTQQILNSNKRFHSFETTFRSMGRIQGVSND